MNWIDLPKHLPWLPHGNVRLLSQETEQAIIGALKELGFRVFVLRGQNVHDEQSFFRETAQLFGFPSYFGNNWDAFNDCFADFAFTTKTPIAILWSDPTSMLTKNLGDFLKAFHELLNAAVGVGMCMDVDRPPVQVEVFLVGREKGFQLKP